MASDADDQGQQRLRREGAGTESLQRTRPAEVVTEVERGHAVESLQPGLYRQAADQSLALAKLHRGLAAEAK
jgi:hypothetical protein